MRIAVEYTLRTPGLDRLLAQYRERAQAACDYQARKLAENAAANAVQRKLIATGGLVGSIYWQSPNHPTGHADALTAMASDGTPRDVARAFGPPALPPPPSAVAAVAARHGMPLNNGFTHNRGGNHVPAKPFWTPAVEQARGEFGDTVQHFILTGAPPGGGGR